MSNIKAIIFLLISVLALIFGGIGVVGTFLDVKYGFHPLHILILFGSSLITIFGVWGVSHTYKAMK